MVFLVMYKTCMHTSQKNNYPFANARVYNIQKGKYHLAKMLYKDTFMLNFV